METIIGEMYSTTLTEAQDLGKGVAKNRTSGEKSRVTSDLKEYKSGEREVLKTDGRRKAW